MLVPMSDWGFDIRCWGLLNAKSSSWTQPACLIRCQSLAESPAICHFQISLAWGFLPFWYCRHISFDSILEQVCQDGGKRVMKSILVTYANLCLTTNVRNTKLPPGSDLGRSSWEEDALGPNAASVPNSMSKSILVYELVCHPVILSSCHPAILPSLSRLSNSGAQPWDSCHNSYASDVFLTAKPVLRTSACHNSCHYSCHNYCQISIGWD